MADAASGFLEGYMQAQQLKQQKQAQEEAKARAVAQQLIQQQQIASQERIAKEQEARLKQQETQRMWENWATNREKQLAAQNTAAVKQQEFDAKLKQAILESRKKTAGNYARDIPGATFESANSAAGLTPDGLHLIEDADPSAQVPASAPHQVPTAPNVTAPSSIAHDLLSRPSLTATGRAAMNTERGANIDKIKAQTHREDALAGLAQTQNEVEKAIAAGKIAEAKAKVQKAQADATMATLKAAAEKDYLAYDQKIHNLTLVEKQLINQGKGIENESKQIDLELKKTYLAKGIDPSTKKPIEDSIDKKLIDSTQSDIEKATKELQDVWKHQQDTRIALNQAQIAANSTPRRSDKDYAAHMTRKNEAPGNIRALQTRLNELDGAELSLNARIAKQTYFLNASTVTQIDPKTGVPQLKPTQASIDAYHKEALDAAALEQFHIADPEHRFGTLKTPAVQKIRQDISDEWENKKKPEPPPKADDHLDRPGYDYDPKTGIYKPKSQEVKPDFPIPGKPLPGTPTAKRLDNAPRKAAQSAKPADKPKHRNMYEEAQAIIDKIEKKPAAEKKPADKPKTPAKKKGQTIYTAPGVTVEKIP